MNKTNNLRAYLRDLYEGIVSKKPDASRNPQNFRSEIEAIRTGGELYEVMDASELPEDAPNGSLALVEGEPIPEAYTVLSVDELPSNAVDGSMGIVQSDSLIGEWEWKDNESSLDLSMLNLPLDSGVDIAEMVRFIGTDDFDDLMNGLHFSKQSDEEFCIYINDYSILYIEDYFDDCFTLLKILTEPNFDLCNIITQDSFKTFLETNCNRLSGGYSLYTHENGQWVYKCEVV